MDERKKNEKLPKERHANEQHLSIFVFVDTLPKRQSWKLVVIKIQSCALLVYFLIKVWKVY